MKRKIGKIVVPLLALMLIAVAIVLYVIHGTAEARPVDDVRDRVGNYTGPISGTAQDDNIKASLDLLHNRIHDKYGGGSTDGSTFYVDSDVAGSAGTDWSTAVGTLDAAIALCGNNHGDVILVAPGHAENLSTADGVDVDVPGVTIIGLGRGDNRPTFTYTNAAGEFVIGADNVVVKNLQFIASVTGITTAINVESGSTDYLIEDCFFDIDTDGTDEFVDCITISTASCDGGIIRNNYFTSGTVSNAGPQSWVNIVDGNDIVIENNKMYGDCAVACIENLTTAAYNITIKDNILFNGIIGGNAGLNTVACISLHANATGVIDGNKLFCNVANPQLAIVGADMFLGHNIYNETEADSAGQIIGTRAGERYVSIKTSAVVSAADDLFDVDGGPIIIEYFVGLVTTNIQAQATTLEIVLDADTGFTDHDFSTAVDLNGDAAGTRIVFSAANEAVLTELAGADGGAGPATAYWFCGEGMIESTPGAASTGAITWYMVWTPLADGTTVTVQ